MKTYLKLFFTALFWGGTFVAGKELASGALSPYSMAFVRFFIASIVLVAFCKVVGERFKFVTQRQFVSLLLLGATGVFAYNVFFFEGLKTIMASRAALIIALNPVAITIGSRLFYKEKLSTLKIIGILISFLGASIVITRGNPFVFFEAKVGLGEVYIVGCVLSFSSYSLLGKRVMAELSPLVTTTYACVLGTAYLFVFSIFDGLMSDLVSLDAPSWLNLAYLGVFGTAVAFIWFFQGVERIGAQRSAIFINFVPVSGVVLASFFLNEPITKTVLSGGLMVLVGVVLLNLHRVESAKTA